MRAPTSGDPPARFRSPAMRGATRACRALPFVALASASLWRASRAPQGRRSPRFDWTLDTDAVLAAVSKWPHITWMATLFALAILAVGATRPAVAAAMTLALGLGWEIAETTVVGHNPRLADLVPDLLGVLAAWAVLAGARALAHPRVITAPARQQHGSHPPRGRHGDRPRAGGRER